MSILVCDSYVIFVIFKYKILYDVFYDKINIIIITNFIASYRSLRVDRGQGRRVALPGDGPRTPREGEAEGVEGEGHGVPGKDGDGGAH